MKKQDTVFINIYNKINNEIVGSIFCKKIHINLHLKANQEIWDLDNYYYKIEFIKA